MSPWIQTTTKCIDKESDNTMKKISLRNFNDLVCSYSINLITQWIVLAVKCFSGISKPKRDPKSQEKEN